MKNLLLIIVALFAGINFGFSQLSWINSPAVSPVSSYRGAAATVNVEGNNPQLYVMGGWGTTNGNFNETSIYNFVGDSWEVGPAIPENVKGGSAVSIGNNIYVLCGNDGVDPNINSKLFLKLDAASGEWEYLSEYPLAARYVAMTYNNNNGLIYCAGGSGDYYTGIDNVYAYNPENDSWITCSPLPFISSGGSALTFIGNHLYLVGGLIDEPYNKIFKGLIDVNDPSNISWTHGMPMPVEMLKTSAAYVGNGNILATELDGTFIYDITADTWSDFDPKPNPVKGGNFATFEFDNAYTLGIAGGRDAGDNYIDHIEYRSFEESIKFPVTFLCTLPNGTPITNAEIQILGTNYYTDESGGKVVFLENGTYNYMAQYEGVQSGGSFTIDGESVYIEVMLPVSIDEHQIGFDIYPNPSPGLVNIIVEDVNLRSVLTSVSIINSLGKKVYTSSLSGSGNHFLDFSGFSKGIYFIKLSDKNGRLTIRKLVIN
jgi:hypothetical protein